MNSISVILSTAKDPFIEECKMLHYVQHDTNNLQTK